MIGGVQWTVAPSAMDWVRERLDDFTTPWVTSLVPAGFDAYARIRQPATGTLPLHEAGVLIDVVRSAGMATSSCWFAVWDGYGWIWGNVARLVISTDPSARPEPLPDELPVPAHIRDGERAWREHRSYLIYTGGIDDALALDGLEYPTFGAVPDLWWPSDRTWFVGSDTDLDSTYVGGPHALIDRLLADERLETQAVDPDDVIG